MKRSCRFGLRLGLNLVVAVVLLCVLFMALEPHAEAGVGAGNGKVVAFGSAVDIAVAVSQKNKIRILRPTKGAHISGKTHIKFKVGQKIKRVFVFIDDKYFASGPPYLSNSATVSNGLHRITVATATPAQTSNALFLVSQSQDTSQFFVHNRLTAPSTTTLTSTLVLTSANNGQTFSNYRISTTSGPCVHAVGASNITISNSNIGPCGVAGNADAEGIRFMGGTGNKVFDSYIHVESTTATAGVETHAGIWADGSTNLTAQGNVIAYTGTGIVADGTNGTGTATGLVAIGNYILNSRGGTGSGGGSYLGSGIEAVDTSDPTIANNYIYQCVTSGNGVPCVGGPYLWDEKVEDNINLFHTDNAVVQQNYIVGGHSCSGDAFTIDLGANSNQALDNIVIGSQGGMQIGSGTNNVMSGNKVFQQQNMCNQDAPFAVMNDYPGTYACGPSTLTNNYGWNTARGSGFWSSGGCGTVIQSGNNFTSSATSALLPIATMLAPPLIPPLPKNCVVKSPYTTQTSMGACP
jgi:hypothetical protein